MRRILFSSSSVLVRSRYNRRPGSDFGEFSLSTVSLRRNLEKLSISYYSTIFPGSAKMTADTKSQTQMSQIMDSSSQQPSYKVLNDLVKSPADQRDFRALELGNGFKVVLVHDSEADKSAAALSVAAGCMCDPVQFPGLAHFLEHMLFLGTEKYPDESGFDAHLHEHGGSSNAFTTLDHTLYYFDVAPDHLIPTLDRFAQFFICPLFNEGSTEREVNAVNSEHEKNIPADGRRLFRIDQVTSNQDHPYSKFSTGSRESLWVKPLAESLDVRKALLEFHDTYYSSNLMVLAVIGKESLDELQSIVESLFSTVENKRRDMLIWPKSPYGEDQLKLRIDVVPVADLRLLRIKFAVPDTIYPFYKAAPSNYVSHLVGHEGEGSLLSLLKRKGWANDLSAGVSATARGFNLFSIEIGLSIDGLENIEAIIEHTFQYLKMLREEEPPKWIWEEIKDIKAIKFRFQDKPTPGKHVVALASKLHNYPLEDILTAGNILTEFNPSVIKDILNACSPENCRITTVSKKNESSANLTEQWYEAKYSVKKIDEAVIQKWTNCSRHEELHLPNKNEFIPSIFDLKPRENTGIIPKLLINAGMNRVWFLQDNEFMLPKARILIELYSPLPLGNPTASVMNEMMVRIITDTLTEIVYPASMAGLSHSVSSTVYGLEIRVSGYDHKLKLLLNKVLDKLINFTVKSDRFNILKDVYARGLKNWEESEPRVHALFFVSNILCEKDYNRQELISALEGVTVEKLERYASDFISQLRLEWLFCGNLTSVEAQGIVEEVQQLFESKGTAPLLPCQQSRLRCVKLAEGSDQVFERDHLTHSSSCVAVLFQDGVKNTRDNVVIELLGQIAEQPCFQQLRTQEQLGYVVHAGVRKLYGILGLVVLVQSHFHPTYLESRIDNFMQTLKEKITAMTEEEFLVYRTALKVRKSEKVKTLAARASELWHEIGIEEFDFDRKNIELNELETISHQDVINYFDKLIGPPVSKTRGRLGVHIISQTKDGAGKKPEPDCFGPFPVDLSGRSIQPISDIFEWKSQQALHSRPKRAIEIPRPDSSVKMEQ